ncbi:serine/threonine-protein kinase [Actinophytocola oryzae]|uniref:non-specific serine/threonine protein kinase n=1 Tax=Actinophytocola oryzae TaxID=502181 RepID=A0A4R7VSM1_9PSEU|nr:serine/threonine-protein kinase [Actinophytocola oryzae]TDV52369.1 serine/threonine protein kinase [Actinophytocola oryzae]
MVIEKDVLVAGRYRLIEQVGSGAMGVVWKAHDERLGRTVAIKRLIVRHALSAPMTEEVRRRAMREARIAARLQHRNAIALFDVAEDEGDPILVMEFLPSKSLSVVLQERGTLPPNEAAEIGAQVADALAAAHAVGIAHRDIKPGNILLAENGTVKITDFGISRALDDGTMTTQTGMLAGTPAYLAPEIARGGDSSRASDVFSLGSTLYHAIEGRPPFGTNTNPLALLHAVASGNVPSPRNAGPLAPTLMSLMRVDPGERPTMKEAAESLATAATQVMPVPTPAATKIATPPRPVLPAQAPPTPPQPLEAMPTAAFRKPEGQPTQAAGPSRRNVVIVGVVALLVLVGTLFTVLIINDDKGGGNSGNTAQGSTSATEQAGNPPAKGGDTSDEPAPSTDDKSTSPNPPAAATQVAPPPGTFIDYSTAGQFVIDYYGTGRSPEQRWAMLSPYGQAQFGSQEAFNQYWAAFPAVSSKEAHIDNANPDGTREVSCTVTYGDGQSARKSVRITMINGGLVIDSLAK